MKLDYYEVFIIFNIPRTHYPEKSLAFVSALVAVHPAPYVWTQHPRHKARVARENCMATVIQALQRGAEVRTRRAKERAEQAAQPEREARTLRRRQVVAATALQARLRGFEVRTRLGKEQVRCRQVAAATALQARARGMAGRTRAAK